MRQVIRDGNPETASLVTALYEVLKTVWGEADRRSHFSADVLVELWARLQAIESEVRECLHDGASDPSGQLAWLRDLKRRAQVELGEVQAGAFDAR